MRMQTTLAELTLALRGRVELELKADIQVAAKAFGRQVRSAWLPGDPTIVNGDDAAAIPHGEEYVLFAAEGMRPEFVARDPWFAGYCSLMVNFSDIAAMGGRPWAVVDTLFLGDGPNHAVLEGMAAASRAYGVPIVGGHTARVTGPTQLAVAVLGRAARLISSYHAEPGQVLLAALDLRGSFRDNSGNFDASTRTPPAQLRAQLALLPELAEAGLVRAGKDVSMAGLCGTLLMLLETSGVGAYLELESVPAPPDVEPTRWLTAFPSFGYVLAVSPDVASQ
ncbi:MAG TPA: sll0787 family AIR synthase-like protein, partial [Polyangiaceae bacterium]